MFHTNIKKRMLIISYPTKISYTSLENREQEKEKKLYYRNYIF